MERNEIEGMFGNLKGKLSGYVAAYREDMAMVLTLVKFLAYNMYVVYFFVAFPGPVLAGVSIIIHLSHGFLKHRQPPCIILLPCIFEKKKVSK